MNTTKMRLIFLLNVLFLELSSQGSTPNRTVEILKRFRMASSAVEDARSIQNLLFQRRGLGSESILLSSRFLSLSPAVSFLSILGDFIISYIEDKDMEIVKQSLDIISNQLTDLQEELDEHTKKIISAINFSTLQTEYIDWAFTIKNGAGRLSSTMNKIRKETDPAKKLKLINDYIRTFEQDQIENAVNNIIRIIGGEETPTTPNLLSLFCKKKKCGFSNLDDFIILVMNDVSSGIKQILIYNYFKYGIEELKASFIQIMKQSDTIRIKYEEMISQVLDNMKTGIESIVKSTMDDHQGSSDNSALSKSINQKLIFRYDWYLWAVSVTGEKPIYNEGQYESRGNNFIYLYKCGPNKDKNVIVQWQYKNTTVPKSCKEFMSDGGTIVFIEGSEGGIPHKVVADSGIMTTSKCWKERQEVQYQYLKIHEPYNMPQWIASAAYDDDSRETRACINHGRCKVIPGSSKRMCICDNGYYGESCEMQKDYENDPLLTAPIDLIGYLNVSSVLGIQKQHLLRGEESVTSMAKRCSEAICANKKCDGRYDCADQGDEINCRYFRSGDIISLESICGGYVNCYCTHNRCGWGYTAHTRQTWCQGKGYNRHSLFIIDNGRSPGSTILHGDLVSFKYVPQQNHSVWLSCPSGGGKCVTEKRSFSAAQHNIVYEHVFGIFSPDRRGQCPSVAIHCHGEPIQWKDIVYIQKGSTWLSGKTGDEVHTTTCPGWYLNSADQNCPCEKFIIEKRDPPVTWINSAHRHSNNPFDFIITVAWLLVMSLTEP